MKPGYFDRTFIEKIIGHHISEEVMAKVKESEREKLQALYRFINYAWKYNNTMTAVNFWDQFRDCFVHPGKSEFKEP